MNVPPTKESGYTSPPGSDFTVTPSGDHDSGGGTPMQSDPTKGSGIYSVDQLRRMANEVVSEPGEWHEYTEAFARAFLEDDEQIAELRRSYSSITVPLERPE